MRPMLKPALRRVWRAESTLQLGTDPESALVLDGVGPDEARFLAGLDGLRTLHQVLRDADPTPGRDTAQRLLDLLARGGALDDASADRAMLAALTGPERDRLAPDLASWSLARAAPGAASTALTRRGGAAVAVHGTGRVGAPLAALLAAAGVGQLRLIDPEPARAADNAPGGLRPDQVGRPRAGGALATIRELAPSVRAATSTGRERLDLAVLCDASADDPAQPARLLSAGVPHLVARVRETVGQVGPLVVPGSTGCLRCLDLHRCDRDPAWPLVAAQLDHPAPTRGGPPAELPCDVALAAAVAAHAALATLARIDEPETPSPLSDAMLELRLPHATPRRRSWEPHPVCGCRWADERVTMTR